MVYESKNIRNVVLLGHPGSGKTTLAEDMLFEAKGISKRGRVEDGNTVSDYTSIEQTKGNSIFSTLMHAGWKDSKINIIDTPGYDDFIGEVLSSLKVADTAVMVLNAKSGVEVGTEIIWEYIEKFKTPAMLVINQLDHEKADYDNCVQQAIDRFGSHLLPVQYPLNQGTGFNSIVDTLRMVMYVFPTGGGKPEKKPIPESEMPRALEMHNKLVEAAAENEDGLMDKFFEQGTLDEADLTKGLTIAMANQQIFPIFCASGAGNMGTGRIMGFINDICPSPIDRPDAILEDGNTLKCDSNDDTTIFIYKTLTEPNVGMVSYFKVYSGTLKTGDELTNHNNRTVERFNQIFVSNGKIREAVPELKAGDLGVTVKLKNSHSNNTLTAKNSDKGIEPIHFPEPRIRAGVKPPSKQDMEKLVKALHQIQEEDPTLILEQNSQLKQTIMHGQGQLHMDIIKYRIEKVNGISMEFEKPKIPYRETITREANETYRHKKQSGGAGQFAEVHIRIEPYHEGMPDPAGLTVKKTEVDELPWGGKLVFVWCIVGGSIDAKFSNAIKKGVMQKMENGPLTGSACTDIRVSVYDGKMHPVDSNDMAFQIAGAQAFKNAFKNSHPQILEPIQNLEILCPDEVMGDIMGDLQTRRAMIVGMDSDGHYQKILAKVPLAELYQYNSTLRSVSQGRAKFKMSFAEFQSVPTDIQQKLAAEHTDHDHDEDI